MKITVFTSNQPRHLSLIRSLATIADEVYAVLEVNTVFPGKKAGFYDKSPVMQEYFTHVMASEKKIFGDISYLPSNVRTLSLQMGDLNEVSLDSFGDALNSDEYVVFGSSFIKGRLIDFLVENKAINIHMGVSPYYRGASCNFWAAYEKNFHMVGSTIHYLSKGLDSGDMLFHALPSACDQAFDLGMQAVKAAHEGLVKHLGSGQIHNMEQVKQDKSQEIKYARYTDFNDEVAQDYLTQLATASDIKKSLDEMDHNLFLHPFIF